MKRIALTTGLLFSLSSFAVIAPQQKPVIFSVVHSLPVYQSKTKLCDALTEKEATRQTKLTKGKKSAPKKESKPSPVSNVCESPSINVTIEEKAKLPKNKTYLSVAPLAYASSAGGYLAAMIETTDGLRSVELSPIVQATAAEKENQKLTILNVKTQDIIAGGAEELLIQYSVTTKSADRTSTKESLLLCGVTKEFLCLMPVRIAESITIAEAAATSWRISYSFANDKITFAPQEVNGKKTSDKNSLRPGVANHIDTWEIPL
jgi:hypothetical protein